jgi:P4 family phage/plasmid primase-like protien
MGVGVLCPSTRNPDLLLCPIDVDFDDPDFLHLVSSVINEPCPVRVGSKGAGFFVTMPNNIDLRSLDDQGVKSANIGSPKTRKLDLLGLKTNAHMVLPPSMHFEVQRPYTWIKFPLRGFKTQQTLSLFDVEINSLPCISAERLREIVWHLKEPDNKLAQFILSDGWQGPGDGTFRDMWMAASHDMVMNQGFPEDYTNMRIDEIASQLQFANPHPLWGDDNDRLMGEVHQATKSSLRKRDKEKSEGKKKRRDREPQIADDRQVFDWFCVTYPPQTTYSFSGRIHHWDGVKWIPLDDADLAEAARQAFQNFGSYPIRTAIRDWNIQMYGNVAKLPSADAVVFRNGVYDIVNDTIRPMVMEDWSPTTLNVDYNEDAECPLWTAHLTTMCHPPAVVHAEPTDIQKTLDTLEEFLGYCLSRSYRFQRMLFVIGESGCGKDTTWQVFRRFFPKGKSSAIAMENLDNPDSLFDMVGSMVNIGGEVGRRNKEVDKALLAITSGGDVEVWKKQSNRLSVAMDARLIFDGNKLPDTADSTGAFERRAIILRCSKRHTEDRPFDLYKDQLWAEAPGIANRLLAAYRRLLERGKFDEPQYSIEAKIELKDEASAVAVWLKECTEPVEAAPRGCISDIAYQNYRMWSQDRGFGNRTLNSITWGKELGSLGYPAHNTKGFNQKGEKTSIRVRKFRLLPEADHTKTKVGEESLYAGRHLRG